MARGYPDWQLPALAAWFAAEVTVADPGAGNVMDFVVPTLDVWGFQVFRYNLNNASAAVRTPQMIIFDGALNEMYRRTSTQNLGAGGSAPVTWVIGLEPDTSDAAKAINAFMPPLSIPGGWRVRFTCAEGLVTTTLSAGRALLNRFTHP